jgi:hypothetical protein
MPTPPRHPSLALRAAAAAATLRRLWLTRRDETEQSSVHSEVSAIEAVCATTEPARRVELKKAFI